MRILFLSQIVPYPPHGGVLQRGYNIIREISREHDVHLLAFVHPDVLTDMAEVDQARTELERICKSVDFFPLWPKKSKLHKIAALAAGIVYTAPFSDLAHRSREFLQRARSIIGEFPIDVIHYDTIGLARYREELPDLPSVVTHHNIESSLMARRSKVEKLALGRWYVARQANLLRTYETAESPKFDVNVFVSETDEAELLSMAPGLRTAIVPNGVDVDYFQPQDEGGEAAIIYTGGMNMFANEDAVLFLLREMWQSIKSEVPGVRFYVIGQDPTREILEFAKTDSSIIVTGYVDDVRPYVARSSVYVVPIRVGGGTRLKVLDALAQGKAIVSTSIGCEGIDVAHGRNIFVEDDPDGFARRTVELLNSGSARRRVGRAARQLAVDKYSWRGIGSILNGVYEDLRARN